MGIVDWLNLPQISNPKISPDGRSVLFTRSVTEWPAGRMITHIWRVEIGGDPVQLTHGAEGENSPVWAPDGKTIGFIARRGGETATHKSTCSRLAAAKHAS
jgi:Tol biopolymer transport system component